MDKKYSKGFFDAKIFFLTLHRLKGGGVAQLVEQRTENPCVGGSNPPATTSFRIEG